MVIAAVIRWAQVRSTNIIKALTYKVILFLILEFTQGFVLPKKASNNQGHNGQSNSRVKEEGNSVNSPSKELNKN